MAQNELLETIGSLEKELSLPSGFLLELRKEGDWSFIIKAHAFLEAALSHVLAEAAGKRDLEAVFSHVDMSDRDKGKLVFAEALDVLGEDERRFVRKLSELRNMLVHNISNIEFNISKYVNRLDRQQRQSFVKAFGYAYAYDSTGLRSLRDTQGIVLKDPHGAIFLGVVLITIMLCEKKVAAHRYRKRIADMETLVAQFRDIHARRQTRPSKEADPQS